MKKRVIVGIAATLFNLSPAHTYATSATPSTKSRDFYEVLEDLFSDFETDLKGGGAAAAFKDVALHKVTLDERTPPSFGDHLEVLVKERVLRVTQVKLVQCPACRVRKRGPITEGEALEQFRVARANSISGFLDLAFSFQPKGMSLAMIITDPESGTISWLRNYNSETSRSAAIRRGVDVVQLDEARKEIPYPPSEQYRAIFYLLREPNLRSQSLCLGLGFRIAERYDNRKKEAGIEFSFLKDTTIITGADPSANIYNGYNLTLLFVHSWKHFGEEENFDRTRGSFFGGLGGTYASAYLSGLMRGGYEWRIGRHYAIALNLGYRAQATAFQGTRGEQKISGLEFGTSLGILF